MKIALKLEAEKRVIGSIKRFFAETMGENIGELKAKLFLDFFLQEIGPSVYNQAIVDAQDLLQGKIEDLAGECFSPEFAYWKKAQTPHP